MPALRISRRRTITSHTERRAHNAVPVGRRWRMWLRLEQRRPKDAFVRLVGHARSLLLRCAQVQRSRCCCSPLSVVVSRHRRRRRRRRFVYGERCARASDRARCCATSPRTQPALAPASRRRFAGTDRPCHLRAPSVWRASKDSAGTVSVAAIARPVPDRPTARPTDRSGERRKFMTGAGLAALAAF